MLELMIQVMTFVLLVLNAAVLHYGNMYFACANCAVKREIRLSDRILILSIQVFSIFLTVVFFGLLFPSMNIFTNLSTIFILEFNYILYLTYIILHLMDSTKRIRICKNQASR